MSISWFDLTEVRRFSEQWAADLHRIHSGASARGDRSAQITRRIDKLMQQVVLFEREQRLNFYKKARLITFVRSALEARGVPAEIRQEMERRLLATRFAAGTQTRR